MDLSKNTIGVLVDMIENKLAVMGMDDREEVREVMTLRNCLRELHTLAAHAAQAPQTTKRRAGRRRKLSALIEESLRSEEARQA